MCEKLAWHYLFSASWDLHILIPTAPQKGFKKIINDKIFLNHVRIYAIVIVAHTNNSSMFISLQTIYSKKVY